MEGKNFRREGIGAAVNVCTQICGIGFQAMLVLPAVYLLWEWHHMRY
ncbi:MAG: hypothetical protein ACYDAE_01380 [Steroidobacteraceae bacterium]